MNKHAPRIAPLILASLLGLAGCGGEVEPQGATPLAGSGSELQWQHLPEDGSEQLTQAPSQLPAATTPGPASAGPLAPVAGPVVAPVAAASFGLDSEAGPEPDAPASAPELAPASNPHPPIPAAAQGEHAAADEFGVSGY